MNAFKSLADPPLIDGKLGPPFLILSSAQIRRAELLEKQELVKTADGPVVGRVGDYVVMMPTGERYPITSRIFLGTYDVLGNIGGAFVGRRLAHVRRAWEVVSESVQISYGDDRGAVQGMRGDWIYQSDEDDYGLINAAATAHSYSKVGPVSDFERLRWAKKTDWVSLALTVLSPLLTLLALFAFAAYSGHLGEQVTATPFLALEGGLLAAALLLVWWSNHKEWTLKSAVEQSFDLSLRAQDAAVALGESKSAAFPNMPLWRGAQKSAQQIGDFSGADLDAIKITIGKVVDMTRRRLKAFRRIERVAAWSGNIVAVVILGVIAFLLFGSHAWYVELIAIWLPSVVGALQALALRKQVERRVTIGEELLAEVNFVAQQIMHYAKAGQDVPISADGHAPVAAALQMLCKVLGQHTQRELALAMADELEAPV